MRNLWPPPVTRMLENEAGADMRLVRQINKGMKIQAGGENMGCSKVGENPENQVICLQCQDEVVRVCPGSPRSPRRAVATRLSSGSAVFHTAKNSPLSCDQAVIRCVMPVPDQIPSGKEKASLSL